MGIIGLIILILFLLGLIVAVGAAWSCRGQAWAASSEVPVNGCQPWAFSCVTAPATEKFLLLWSGGKCRLGEYGD